MTEPSHHPDPPSSGEDDAVVAAENEDAGMPIDPTEGSKPSQSSVSSCQKSLADAASTMLSTTDVTMNRLNK